ncbi:branched-chain amino acid ABC transporter permease [Rhodobacteraceae bacterium]|nr:branched-chain amino acid ABC transporter permease [Paracoccaceae bacterium]
MAYLLFSLSLLLVYVGLAQMLHVQFGLLGIPNFGVVGFWGFGMYFVGVLQVQLSMSFIDAMVLSSVLLAVISYGLGHLILRLERQAILCATIAFSAIVALLIVTEKWATMGVVGLGTIRYPLRVFEAEEILHFVILLAFVIGAQIYLMRLHKSRLGRLMVAIRDNEELAASLGKDTFRVKLRAFTITATIMGILGGLSAALNQFLTPNMIVPSITFAVWISLVLGGKEHALGGMIGVFITFGIFDIFIETYAPVSPEFAVLVPNIKLFLYGALLVAVLLYRPTGLLDRDTEPRDILIGSLGAIAASITAVVTGLSWIAKGFESLAARAKKDDDA